MSELRDLLDKDMKQKHATDAGTEMHLRLQRLNISAPRNDEEANLVAAINSCDGLINFFGPNSRPEVPIAGEINGNFISRRIDRLVIDDAARIVKILDYKTDVTHGNHTEQLKEYIQLLHQIYPDYTITAHILWTHEWKLEQII